MKYDYLVVGAGLFGSTLAYLLKEKGKKVLVVEKRDHIAGNIYTYDDEGIDVHKYGAHIFHTSDKEVWDFVNKFVHMNNFINSPLAKYHNKYYHLPFNMNTFCEVWSDVKTSEDAKRKINEEIKAANIKEPTNLEEQAISLVGTSIFKILIKEYTEKQWGKDCKELPPFIIKRLPVRFEFNNNYFNDIYQGIPIEGYTFLVESLLKDIDVRLNTDFNKNKQELTSLADKIIYTGPLDEYFNYCFGYLEYRSLRFDIETVNVDSYQGNAVVNYTDHSVPYTRIIEHKYFKEISNHNKTVITKEYPIDWKLGLERYYPVNDDKNNALYQKYLLEAKKHPNIIFGGRLGTYKYLDMDDTIIEAFKLFKEIIG